jgi:hypothetical protein
MPKRRAKPAGAWSLVFRGGSLESDAGVWNPTCPPDWANKLADGGVERYVLVDRDEAAKVATLAYSVEGRMMPDGSIQMPVAFNPSTQPEIFMGLASGKPDAWYNQEPYTIPAKVRQDDEH